MKKHFLWAITLAVWAFTGCQTSTQSLLETEQYALNDVHYLTDAQQDSIEIHLVFELPTHLPNDSVLIPIQKQILGNLFGEAYGNMEAGQAMNAYAAMLKTEYLMENTELAEEIANEQASDEDYVPLAGRLCETQELSGQIMSMEHDVISYGIERWVYKGGAHGLNFRQFKNYSLTTGKLITEKDLFVEGSDDELTEMMLTELLEQNEEAHAEQDLREMGYEVEGIRPNGNFYLDTDGVVWVFNPYDIAPYAVGETVLLLSWENLQPLMK